MSVEEAKNNVATAACAEDWDDLYGPSKNFTDSLDRLILEVQAALLLRLWPGGPNIDAGGKSWNATIKKILDDVRDKLAKMKVPA